MSAPPAVGGRLGDGEGRRVWFLGNLMVIKCGDRPGEVMSVVDGHLQAGHAPPLHLHRNEEETFWVLEGTVRFRCGEEEFDAGAGEFVHVGVGVAHAFRVAHGGARMLMLASSRELARFMVAGGEPAGGGAPPPPSAERLAAVTALAAQHDMTVVGPPLD